MKKKNKFNYNVIVRFPYEFFFIDSVKQSLLIIYRDKTVVVALECMYSQHLAHTMFDYNQYSNYMHEEPSI